MPRIPTIDGRDSYRSPFRPDLIQFRRRSERVLPSKQFDPPPRRFAIWAATIGIFLPFTIGDTGKYVVALLFLPAIWILLTRKRKFVLSDLLVWGMGLWMILAKMTSDLLFSSVSEAFAFVGSYTLARAFIYGDAAVNEFVKALKIVAVVAVALAIFDTLTGSFFTTDFLRNLFHTPRPFRDVEPVELRRSLLGVTVLRAESIFDHPIFFGSFCAFCNAIFLFLERRTASRLFFCAICIFGIVISISSAAILGFAISISIFIYDRFLGAFSWRWKILPLTACGAFVVLSALSDNPLTWLIRYTTVDPADGYYRLLIWEDAIYFISQSPLIGADPITWAGEEILGNSIDCVWLVLSLVYGLPVICILLLANVSASGSLRKNIDFRTADPKILRTRTAFSLVLFLFVFIGLTVHYWGALWMFWGFAIGIRSSLEEYCRMHWPNRRRLETLPDRQPRTAHPPG
jgi:hypothetical protein